MVAPRLTLVSGADRQFYRKLCQFVLSAQRHAPEYPLFLYDLGLTDAQVDDLRRRHPEVTLRRFPFENYPEFVSRYEDIDPAGKRPPVLGYYAWKPMILSDMMEQQGGLLFWMDSATLIHGSLDPVIQQLRAHGLWCPISGSGRLQDWTDPRTLDLMEASPRVRTSRNRHGGLIALDSSHPVAAQVMKEWKSWSLREECISPPGCNVSRHRYDQCLLTVLLNQYAERGELVLTLDENNISSLNPVPYLSVGNKVHERLPLWLDPLARLYFAIYRALDRLVLRWRARGSK